MKRLYWQCFPPEDIPDVVDDFNLIFEQGREVGLLARQAFPGGVLIEEDHRHLQDALAHTQALLADRNVPAIFEATFAYHDALVRVDVLERLRRNRWRLIEVKQSTQVKDDHIADVAIQKYVLERSGINLGGVCLMHVNSKYVYNGNRLRLDRLFTRADISREAREFEPQILRHLAEMRTALARRSPPKIEAGNQCSTPYRCEFFELCNEDPSYDHISNLPTISSKKLNALRDDGIESIRDIPADFALSERQLVASQCVKTRRPYFGPKLGEALSKLRYPLCFMDFESSNPAIPRFAGMRPYNIIPFQWSVHLQRRPGGTLEHFEFLADATGDPRKDFIDSLLPVLEAQGAGGHIVVYNQAFENGRLTNLAWWLPKFADRIKKIQARLFDLLPIVRQHVYHHDFCGSFSLKDVLPALTPMSYGAMEVGGGDKATAAYEMMVRGLLSPHETARMRKALLAYCTQDTLAMVGLLDRLRKEVGVKASLKKRMKSR